MQSIKKNSEAMLCAHIAKLLETNQHWLALHIHLSQLHAPATFAAIDAIKHLAMALAGHRNTQMYTLPNQDLILILQRTPASAVSRLAARICEKFPFDAVAQKPITERGNELCELFLTKESQLQLQKSVTHMQLAHNGLTLPETVVETGNADFALYAQKTRKARSRIAVLVVEDHRFSSQMVVEILGRHFEVTVAASGAEALKIYEMIAPDIVFLDIGLPDMSGQDVLNRIAKLDPDSFVVMLTADRSQEKVQYALSHQAKGYIIKPFSKQKIEQYLNVYYQRFPERAVKL